MMKTPRRVMLAEELDEQGSPVLAAMEYYDAEMTREEYVRTNYVGEVGPSDHIPTDVEATFPAQFRRKALLDSPSVSVRLQ